MLMEGGDLQWHLYQLYEPFLRFRRGEKIDLVSYVLNLKNIRGGGW